MRRLEVLVGANAFVFANLYLFLLLLHIVYDGELASPALLHVQSGTGLTENPVSEMDGKITETVSVGYRNIPYDNV